MQKNEATERRAVSWFVSEKNRAREKGQMRVRDKCWDSYIENLRSKIRLRRPPHPPKPRYSPHIDEAT
jgi:hypothetical protein